MGRSFYKIAIFIFYCILDVTSAFGVAPTFQTRGAAGRADATTNTKPSSSLHCICINCKWVTSCKAYHFVETQHEQPHMTENPTFEPRDGSPTIHVNIRTMQTPEQEAEIERMEREHTAETERAEEKRRLSSTGDGDADDRTVMLHGETAYDLTPVTTIEYDVVKCADFVEDKGCWVRNMPKAIKDANPHFVPT